MELWSVLLEGAGVLVSVVSLCFVVLWPRCRSKVFLNVYLALAAAKGLEWLLVSLSPSTGFQQSWAATLQFVMIVVNLLQLAVAPLMMLFFCISMRLELTNLRYRLEMAEASAPRRAE